MLRLLIACGVVACAPWAQAQDFRTSFTAVTPKNFDSGGAISRQFHLNAEAYFPMTTIHRTGPARDLIAAPDPALADLNVRHGEATSRFADYVANDPLLDGVVVLRGGEIVFEAYPNMRAHGRHFAWSVTKVVTATTLAALADQGRVDMQAPVERYVPALAASAWAGTPVQAIADMASGIDCRDSDGYQKTSTCIYRMEEALGITASTGRKRDFIQELQRMKRRGPAGVTNEYVSANTNVLMLVIEGVTGEPYAKAVERLVWTRIGAEADGLMAISKAGYAYGSGGLHARLRDVARFGQIYTRSAELGVVSDARVRAMQTGGVPLSPAALDELPKALAEDPPVRASWQWDAIWSDGGMFKGGYSGQGLYVDPSRDLVIAWFGTGLNFNATRNAMLPVSRQIARAMDGAQAR